MARQGKVDFRELKDFQKKIEKLQKVDFEAFCEEAAKELAARLLAKVIQKTQPGIYPASSGKKGGTLRRGWTAKSEAEAIAGKTPNAKTYADLLEIKKTGNVYEIEIINPVHYASYVEYGHRTRNHKGWVQGRFYLTKSEIELDAQAPKILEKKLMKYLTKYLEN
jgi:hypothetical protein